MIFNPSFPYRLTHMVVAAYLATALVVGASGAWHLLRGRDDAAIRTMTSMAMWMLLLVAPLQAFIGDRTGSTRCSTSRPRSRRSKGHWENKPGEAVPLTLFGWPDMAREETLYAIADPAPRQPHPHAHVERPVPGLKEFAPRGPAAIRRSCSGRSASWSAWAC